MTNSSGANLDARSAPEGPATGRCRSTKPLQIVVSLRGCRVRLRRPRNDVGENHELAKIMIEEIPW